MAASIRARLEAKLFDRVMASVAVAAQIRGVRALVPPFLSGCAVLVRRYRRARPGPLSAAELGAQWQRMMPNPGVVPITLVEGGAAHGEIHVRCPLRGTGDLEACRRLMAFDRALLAPVGARFVVLRSQAEPGVAHCTIAMHPTRLARPDLIDAHLRGQPSPAPQPAPDRSSR